MNTLSFDHPGSYIVMGLGLFFAFSNGFRDSSTIVATVVSTRALTPAKAFLLCAIFEFIGAFFIGSAVASRISKNFFDPGVIGHSSLIPLVMGSAFSSSILWGGISWWKGWPTSNGHALISGLFGASLAAWGWHPSQSVVVLKILVVLILSPLIGFLFSTLVTKFVRWAGEWMTPKIHPWLEQIHVASCLLVSCAHGSNDGQTIMGVLMVGLGFVIPAMTKVPLNIRFIVGMAISIGVLFGGRRILKKLGMSFYRIQSTQGLGAQLTSAVTVLSCAMNGFPASTTQVITGSIVGAGVAKNPRSLKWHVAHEIVMAWIITLPSVCLLSSLLFWGAHHFLRGGI